MGQLINWETTTSTVESVGMAMGRPSLSVDAQNRVTLRWNGSLGMKYQVAWDKGNFFEDAPRESYAVTERSSFTTDPLAAGTKYRFAVRSISESGMSPYSPAAEINIP